MTTRQYTEEEAAALRKLGRESGEKIKADRLIREAAPDLLAACEAYMDRASIVGSLDKDNCFAIKLPLRVVDMISNAVAKARGQNG